MGHERSRRSGVYVVKLNAAGDHIWSRSINAVPYVAATSLGQVMLSGTFTSTLLLGDGLQLNISGEGGTPCKKKFTVRGSSTSISQTVYPLWIQFE